MKVISAGINDSAGASMYSQRLAWVGTMSSLKIIFSPSAKGCNNPHGPTRFGPTRICIQLMTLRSMSVTYATAVTSMNRITKVLITHSRRRLAIRSDKTQAAQTFISFIPLENSLSPDVNQPDEQNNHKDHHLAVEDVLQMPVSFRLHDAAKDNRPRNQKHGFDVEQQESHRNQVELNRLALTGRPHWF